MYYVANKYIVQLNNYYFENNSETNIWTSVINLPSQHQSATGETPGQKP